MAHYHNNFNACGEGQEAITYDTVSITFLACYLRSDVTICLDSICENVRLKSRRMNVLFRVQKL